MMYTYPHLTSHVGPITGVTITKRIQEKINSLKDSNMAVISEYNCYRLPIKLNHHENKKHY